MPKKVNKGGFSEAFSESFVSHRTDETVYGAGGELPPGIDGGIAKLAMLKIGEYKSGDLQGEKYFMAQGVVVSPEEFNKQRVKGLRTSIGPEPLCDTEGRTRETLDDHVAWMSNQLRMLAGDEYFAEADTLEEVEELMEALVESDVYFRFRTWQGKATDQYPNPRTNHEWRGAVEYDEDGTDDVEDDTEEEEEVKPKKGKGKASAKPSSKTTSTKGGSTKGKKGKAEPEEEEEDDVPFGDDLDMLADAAEEDEEAADKLTKLAVKAGIDEEWVESAPGWQDVADKIREMSEEGGDEEEDEEEEEEEVQPEKGDTFAYKPKGKKKAIEVEVTAVFEGKQTCNCKDDKGTVYKAVPWSALEAT